MSTYYTFSCRIRGNLCDAYKPPHDSVKTRLNNIPEVRKWVSFARECKATSIRVKRHVE